MTNTGRKRKLSSGDEAAAPPDAAPEAAETVAAEEPAADPPAEAQPDNDGAPPASQPQPEDAAPTPSAKQEFHLPPPSSGGVKPNSSNPYDRIRRAVVVNDGTPRNLVRLIGLKSLFARQLPKMPKEYIARLVFDKRHKSLAILSDDAERRDCDEEIIGGICYRAYKEMRFAEIAFCAVSASQQVKGYGTKLMNLLKMHAVTEGIEYFITYADNYAIGYFKKQGFTKAVQMPKGRYQGLIKDYDGGTIMECYVHASIDFTRVPETIAAQKKFIQERIRATSKSDKVEYPPLPEDFKESVAAETTARGPALVTERALAIPGVVEAGWTKNDLLASAMENTDADVKKNQLKSELMALMKKVTEQQFAWCFREPVDTEEVTDYLEVVTDPIDLKTMERRIRRGDWYRNKHMLYCDMMRMVNNCKLYNGEGSTYTAHAVQLEKYLANIFPRKITEGAGGA